MTPTLSFLARSRSAASVLNNSKDGRKLKEINAAFIFAAKLCNVSNCLFLLGSPLCPRSASASPLTLCTHQPHHRCFDHWRVTSSTPDITQRQHRRSSTPVSFSIYHNDVLRVKYLYTFCNSDPSSFYFMAFNRCLWARFRKCPSESQKFDIRFILFSHKDG